MQQREIKFRAWDKIEGIMYSAPFIYQFDGYLNKDWFRLSYLHFMQYTGIKDKNGVEIYEGDIVKVQGWNKTEKEWCRNMEVVFHEGCFCLKHDEGLYAFFRDIEIIGNIYENPELLN